MDSAARMSFKPDCFICALPLPVMTFILKFNQAPVIFVSDFLPGYLRKGKVSENICFFLRNDQVCLERPIELLTKDLKETAIWQGTSGSLKTCLTLVGKSGLLSHM